MANVLAELFQNTANAIREKTGDTGTMKPAEFPEKIRAIETGGSTSDAVVWTVTFIGADGAVLYQRPCIDGDDCYDPVITEKIDTPTKESTPQYTYDYDGWSLTDGGTADGNALANVTEDRTVYAAFAESVRYYTVRFFDGETVLKTESVAYGSKATPPEAIKDGYALTGWGTDDFTITTDTDFYAEWEVDAGYAVKMADAASLPSNACYGVAYNGDGTRLIVTEKLGGVYVYDATTEPYTLIKNYTVTFDSTAAASTIGAQYVGYINNYANYVIVSGFSTEKYRISIYDAETHTRVSYLDNNYYQKQGSNTIDAIAISNSMDKIAVLKYEASQKERADIYNVDGTTITKVGSASTGTAIYSNSGYYNSISFNGDGTRVMFTGNHGANKNSIYAFDTETLQNVTGNAISYDDYSNYFTSQYSTPYCKLAYSRDGRYLAIFRQKSGAYKGIFYLFDTSTTPYTLLRKSPDMTNFTCCGGFCFSPDSSVLAIEFIATDGGLRFYDSETFALKNEIEVNIASAANSGCYNNAGTRYATALSRTPSLAVYKTKA